MRIERDNLGKLSIDDDIYYGIHTARAKSNFAFSNYYLPKEFITAFAEVKYAAAWTNKLLGYLPDQKAEAIIHVCKELIAGKLHEQIVVDPFQGGAGTSTNMNFNEVIANRAIELLGGQKGEYEIVHPLHDVNMHQSTNDVYPTAVRITVLKMLRELEKNVADLQSEFQKKEKEFASVVKLGRTEMQDAVPMTLGMEFSAYAEAIARDRWRIFKSRERIKVMNLGGTAIGTGLGAPRKYIFKVTEILRDITGLNLARSENLVDATQNLDSFVEVSGMLKAYATNLLKIATDLRILASGPNGGINEISLPPLQAGSTIMPGKVNPVMLEAVSQIAIKVMSNDFIITTTASLGNLELNQFLPLLAYSIMESLIILINGTKLFSKKCVAEIRANTKKCEENLFNSKSIAASLVHILGYKNVEKIVNESVNTGKSIKDILLTNNILSENEIDELLTPKKLYKLGYTEDEIKRD